MFVPLFLKTKSKNWLTNVCSRWRGWHYLWWQNSLWSSLCNVNHLWSSNVFVRAPDNFLVCLFLFRWRRQMFLAWTQPTYLRYLYESCNTLARPIFEKMFPQKMIRPGSMTFTTRWTSTTRRWATVWIDWSPRRSVKISLQKALTKCAYNCAARFHSLPPT